jgi:hypothetical protein
MNRLSYASLSIVGILIASLGTTSRAAVPYSEDWSSGGVNGWEGSTTSSVVVRDAGIGNPAGSLAIRRDLTPQVFPTGATSELPAISGDYTGAAAWMVSFDVFYDIGNITDTWLRFRYQDFTFNGWHLDVADVFPNSWQSYSAMFDPTWTDLEAAANGWVDETAGTVSWQQLMTDVYHPEVRLIEGDDFSAIAYLDNFVLKAVPEPGTSALLVSAAGAISVAGRARRRRQN